jgi:hypothetical protein
MPAMPMRAARTAVAVKTCFMAASWSLEFNEMRALS